MEEQAIARGEAIKYFTPTIEEFVYGYEYQLKSDLASEEIWDTAIFSTVLRGGESIKNYLDNGQIRVPYLNRQAILADGWKVDTRHKTTDTIGVYTKPNLWLIVHFEEDIPLIKLLCVDKKKVDLRQVGYVLICQKAADINTFRFLTKKYIKWDL